MQSHTVLIAGLGTARVYTVSVNREADQREFDSALAYDVDLNSHVPF